MYFSASWLFYQNIAFPFAAQNDYNTHENLTPQYNVNSAFNEKIQHFSNKGEQGYSLVKSRLQKEFGSPCVIADVGEKQLKNAIPVKANEPAALKRFAESLEKALIILEEIDYLGSLNSIDTITLFVNKLPELG